MDSQDKVIIDTNVFVAIALVKDPHHQTAKKLINNLIEEGKGFVTNNLVYHEALTVATLRSKTLDTAVFLSTKIFNKKTGIEIKHILVSWEEDITTFFLNQKKYKNDFLSFVDCSLIIQARKQHIASLFTFDKAFKHFSGEFEIIGVA